MATNYVQEGKSMYLATVDEAKSGDAFVVGDYLPCVLLTDAGADPYMATVATEGVFKLTCDGDSNGAISAGDMLYWTSKDTPLCKDGSKKAFGIALEATSDSSEDILVLLNPKATIPGSVDTDDIDSEAVTQPKLADNAVIARVIAAGAVVEAKLGAAAVAYDKLKADVTKHFNHKLAGPHGTKLEPTTSGFYMLVTATAEAAFTMGDPEFEGQKVSITFDDRNNSEDLVITFDSDFNENGDDIMTMDTEGESAVLVGVLVSGTSTLEWRIVASHGTLALSSTT